MNIYNVIILDESGSMSSIYYETLASMNEVLRGIRKDQEIHPDQKNFVSIVTFQGDGISGVRARRDRVPIESIADFSDEDYRPGGCTPLYDAMGKTLTELERLVHKDDRVLATVITDGMENASEEYSGKAVKKLVDRLREKGWTLAYIGANQNAIEVAKELHIANALNFCATGEGVAVMGVKFKKARAKAGNLWKIQEINGICEPMYNLFDGGTADES